MYFRSGVFVFKWPICQSLYRLIYMLGAELREYGQGLGRAAEVVKKINNNNNESLIIIFELSVCVCEIKYLS